MLLGDAEGPQGPQDELAIAQILYTRIYVCICICIMQIEIDFHLFLGVVYPFTDIEIYVHPPMLHGAGICTNM